MNQGDSICCFTVLPCIAPNTPPDFFNNVSSATSSYTDLKELNESLLDLVLANCSSVYLTSFASIGNPVSSIPVSPILVNVSTVLNKAELESKLPVNKANINPELPGKELANWKQLMNTNGPPKANAM
ncbi:unnamed protein product [Ambrosiozyma monospora]|uniref:Unnamed protein product n=1 Tax=Ambrosiozyma monospora TaxID=43982 RepID=A0ACB5UA94_AMBMO|nr:unnamed protein product [Ambrosiozyma monospora]